MKKTTDLLLLVCLLLGIVLIGSCKKDKNLAVLSTTAVSEITISSVKTGGNITDGGGADITARGVCWSTSQNPTISGSHTTDGKGSGSFTSQITGLDPNTTYYIKAYATNSVGTSYGNEVNFTTTAIVIPTLTTVEVTSTTLTSAVSGGTVTSDGGGAITAKGVCWSTTANPTPSLTTKTDEGAGSASFTSNITGLTPSTTYYYRAYATNSAGTGYGTELTFTTAAIVTPTVTTVAISSITLTSAVSGGTIASDGGASITAKGVCWSTSPTPTVALTTKTDEGAGIASFTSSLTNLAAGTTYYVRAYATNSAGTGYGESISFPTSPVVIPTLVTVTATAVEQTTATSGGTISADGGGAITAKGVCWSTSPAPTALLATKTNEGAGSTSFTSNIINLLPGTTYFYRAYATNSAGTAYGTELSLLTKPVLVATVTTVTASAVTQTSAVSGGTIPSNGGGAVTAKGVCWSTSPAPTALLATKTNEGGGSASFTSNITGLLPGTSYYYRAYATNSAGTSYGTELTLTTGLVLQATLTTTLVSSINTTTAVSGGTITSDGGGTITERGICWSVNQTPTTADATATGTGTTTFTSNLSSLLTGTTYYVRAYAVNGAGTAYGNQVVFNTRLADVDGNSYNVVVIGTQMWMAENLKTTRLNNNTAITNVTDNTAWSLLTTPAYCWYLNSSAQYKDVYGAMYNWFTVNTGLLCPSGWSVPSDDDFKTLETSIGITPAEIDVWGWRGTTQGDQLKNTTGWNTNENGTNTTGFSALPGGYRYAVTGTFNDRGNLSFWWTSTTVDATTAWYRRLDGNNTAIYRAGVEYTAGKYIRCVKD